MIHNLPGHHFTYQRTTRSLWSRKTPVPLIYGESQAVCRNSFAFQTSPNLSSPLELSYHRNSGDERRTFSATMSLQDVNSPLTDKAKQNNFWHHCGLFRRIATVCTNGRNCMGMSFSQYCWQEVCRFMSFLWVCLWSFEFDAAKLHSPLKMFEHITMKTVGHNKVKQGLSAEADQRKHTQKAHWV